MTRRAALADMLDGVGLDNLTNGTGQDIGDVSIDDILNTFQWHRFVSMWGDIGAAAAVVMQRPPGVTALEIEATLRTLGIVKAPTLSFFGPFKF